jgi:hypothetical protein
MPRLARLDAPGVLHHVMGRGIEKNNIFLKNKDRNDFIRRLSLLVEQGAFHVYAWAPMPTQNVSLSKFDSVSRRRALVNARRIVSWLAVHELGYSRAEVARHLGVTNSCITRFLSLGEKPETEKGVIGVMHV